MQYQDLKQKIKGLKVQTLEGKTISVASLWQDRRILLAFLRHFG